MSFRFIFTTDETRTNPDTNEVLPVKEETYYADDLNAGFAMALKRADKFGHGKVVASKALTTDSKKSEGGWTETRYTERMRRSKKNVEAAA